MSDEQRLNSLDRFRKQPGRLVLEEHSHCEVPAGCGGVVLRWRNPLAGVPVTIHLYSPVKAVCLLDGEELQTGRIDLVPGRHVAAVFLEKVDLSGNLLMFGAKHDPKELQRVVPAEIQEPPLKVVSAADGSWKFSLDRPPDEWTNLTFDDGDWPTLVKTATPKLQWGDFGSSACDDCTEQGAECLRLPQPADTSRVSWWRKLLGDRPGKQVTLGPGDIWIRKVFDVPAPQSSSPPA
ncbi:MAG TPA: hypothetical protein VEL76_22210 [Gemmataceae bacterium]|nr:hypothetical protein [Gemmataceae bacterium]